MVGKARRIKLSGLGSAKSNSAPKATPRPSGIQPVKTKGVSSKPDQAWRAEMDAQTLAEAAAVHADPNRHGAARKAAAKMAKEHEAKLANLRVIAKKGAS